MKRDRAMFVFLAAGCLAAPAAAQVGLRVLPAPRAMPSVTPLPVFSPPLGALTGALPAPSFQPFLLPAPALAAVPIPVAPAAAPGAPTSEAAAADAAKAFDGSVAPAATPVAAPSLGAGLRTMRTEDEAWLADVVAQLAATRTGRRILRDAAALASKRGYPIIVEVAPISNNGEFRYDSAVLVIDAPHRRSALPLTAPILAHELQHALQRAQGLPSDALELEIESYTVENRVWSELGIEPPRGSFAALARRRLLQGVDVFVPWLVKEDKNNIPLHGNAMAEYVGKLEKRRATTLKRIARAEKDIKSAERAQVKMRAAGMPEEAIAAHAREELEPAQRRLLDARMTLGWHDRDLALLADEAGRASFRAYSRGVIRRARSLSR